MTYDTVIIDSHVILPTGKIDKNIVIDDGKIVGFTNDIPACDHKINGNGLISIPGAIDTHVHYGVYSPIKNKGLYKSNEIFSTRLNINRAKKILRWKPLYSLEKGLRNTIYKRNLLKE